MESGAVITCTEAITHHGIPNCVLILNYTFVVLQLIIFNFEFPEINNTAMSDFRLYFSGKVIYSGISSPMDSSHTLQIYISTLNWTYRAIHNVLVIKNHSIYIEKVSSIFI